MNISHPSPQTPGVRSMQELHLDRSARTEPNRDQPENLTAARRSLWEILTPEEREFFEQQASLGPVTYRPGRTSVDNASAPTGRRIDVRG